jgi:hypothetical protein
MKENSKMGNSMGMEHTIMRMARGKLASIKMGKVMETIRCTMSKMS